MFTIYKKIKGSLGLGLIVLAAFLHSCDKDDDASNTVTLKSFGPLTLRGGPVSFIGTNLHRVNAVVFPDGIQVTTFETKSSTLLTMTVPEEAVEGIVILKTPEGEIRTKTALAILEPITIESVTPATVRPGEVITIEGTYLNLIKKVTFSNNKTVTSFESQSRTTLQVKVPMDAQSGIIALADGETVPNVIETETALQVKLPVISSVSPAVVKAGNNITLAGTDLDLATEVLFGGGKKVAAADLVSKSATEIVVKVPADAQKGKIELNTASLVKVQSATELALVVSTITSITPSPAKTGSTITVTGTDLDLVDQVTFEGGKTGTIQSGGTATQLTVKIPDDAKSGAVAFRTKNNETATSAELPMVKPTITSFTPGTVETEDSPSITITGTDLDLVKSVVFGGDVTAVVTGATATQIVIAVEPGSLSGNFKLVAKNGDEVASAAPLTIVPDVPSIPVMPEFGVISSKLVLTGTNMDVVADVIFPGDKVATKFGTKTPTTIEVYVPEGTAVGTGKIKFVTEKKEVYMSPDILIKDADALKFVIYDDALAAGFQVWGWGGPADAASTEQVKEGTKSIKKTYAEAFQGLQLGNGNAPVSGYNTFNVSIYGGPGTDGKKIRLVINGKYGGGEYATFTILEGQWKDFSATWSEVVNPATITEIVLQSEFAGTVYVDKMGFK